MYSPASFTCRSRRQSTAQHEAGPALQRNILCCWWLYRSAAQGRAETKDPGRGEEAAFFGRERDRHRRHRECPSSCTRSMMTHLTTIQRSFVISSRMTWNLDDWTRISFNLGITRHVHTRKVHAYPPCPRWQRSQFSPDRFFHSFLAALCIYIPHYSVFVLSTHTPYSMGASARFHPMPNIPPVVISFLPKVPGRALLTS